MKRKWLVGWAQVDRAGEDEGVKGLVMQCQAGNKNDVTRRQLFDLSV